MTPEAQRIAIAEACEWELVEIDEDTHYCLVEIDNSLAEVDPLKDLNAMHEAHETLTYSEHRIYVSHLQEIVYRDGFLDTNKHRSVSHATAAQRAKAFLRAKGKWKD